MRIAPGDLMVLTWLHLDDKPQSSYLILGVNDDEDRFMYFHSQNMKYHWSNVSAIQNSVRIGELEVGVYRVEHMSSSVLR